MSGSRISWAICKSAPCSRQTTTPAPHHSFFYRPDALSAAQPTASKHWRHCSKLSRLIYYYYHHTHLMASFSRTTWVSWYQKGKSSLDLNEINLDYYAFSALTLLVGRQEGHPPIRPVKNWVVGCWHGYLCGARCRPSWCHCHSLSLASVKSRLVYLSGTGLPRSSRKKGR